MYTIKEKPEDFLVKEIPDYELGEGIYAYFWLTKKNENTIDAARRIAEKLKIPLKNIGFAGTKDKIAITKQVISIKKGKKEEIKLKDITLEYIGQGNTPISLGDLKGNEFVITVRNIKTKRIKTSGLIPNLFGPQRFSKNNAEIGKYLVKKQFNKAVELINNPGVQEHLESSPADYIGALRIIPLKTRKIYIHAYQSLLWNKTVEQFLKTGHNTNRKIPIIGFQTDREEIKDADLKEILLNILKQEEITERNFIIPQIKELSSEGAERDLFVKPENLEIDIKEKTAIVSFSLKKGSYATVVVDMLFG